MLGVMVTTTPTRCVLLGAASQLGFDLARTFHLPGELIRLARADLDITDATAVERTLRALQPTHVLNAAAYNLVDQAEDDRDTAFAVNARAVGTVAEVCRALGATLVHFSTDYVFDGRQRRPYREDDAPGPLSVYAESKLAGERLALDCCRQAFVVRVCGLFGVGRSRTAGRTNFVETMLRLACEGRAIRVVRDQILSPSYTRDIAPKVWRLLARGTPGIYHLTNAGQTSFYDFAREIFRLSGLAPDLTAVTAAEFGARARRPAYSVLARERLAALGEDDLRPWPDALAAYLKERSSR
jgi:dTDP-4-dehydrorhamnose reductase